LVFDHNAVEKEREKKSEARTFRTVRADVLARKGKERGKSGSGPRASGERRGRREGRKQNRRLRVRGEGGLHSPRGKKGEKEESRSAHAMILSLF